jgi:hypothetical protein
MIVLAACLGFLLGMAVMAVHARAELKRLKRLGRGLLLAIEADQARRSPIASTFRDLLRVSFNGEQK